MTKLADKPEEKGFWDKFPRTGQAFILALIIISSYVVFFAWIIFSSPHIINDNKNVIAINYEGMKDLTATFGIVAAAVVGYYFGTRNLEQATNLAVDAKKEADEKKVEAKEANKAAKESKAEAESVKKILTKEIKNADPFYDMFEKLTTEKDKNVGEAVRKTANMDTETLNEKIRNRRTHLNQMLERREKEQNEKDSLNSEK
jgi:lipopolysaccharide export LptBFGC system permease protein LptF